MKARLPSLRDRADVHCRQHCQRATQAGRRGDAQRQGLPFPVRGKPSVENATDGANYKLGVGRPRERERERERRVSDADASYYGPARSTRTLSNAIPQRKHAKDNSL